MHATRTKKRTKKAYRSVIAGWAINLSEKGPSEFYGNGCCAISNNHMTAASDANIHIIVYGDTIGH